MRAFFVSTCGMVVGIVYTPISPGETIFITFSIFLTAGVFGYTLTFIGTIINENNKKYEDYKNEVAIINTYMNKKNVAKDLQMRVHNFLEY